MLRNIHKSLRYEISFLAPTAISGHWHILLLLRPNGQTTGFYFIAVEVVDRTLLYHYTDT